MFFGYFTSGDIGVLIGLLITFTAAQFTESYILQPYVVGDKVDLHPFFVILSVVVGNVLWGVIGMILAIPIMAVLAITFLHIRLLLICQENIMGKNFLRAAFDRFLW